ncbi:LOW QUALITY PROTEIN: hypothetical protein OSB04_007100 [Centaurea solstitialis]|uniref:DDE Tnp4 domain-containing protein n=1 Tax=Centaurea solstitialis TaxID=347529 RepID=A0AA38TVX7_9ASTR|nr:LOW QUALITY PROTEIN: hypothetical protein OSB04_007100 [Centaurea solstitialis]
MATCRQLNYPSWRNLYPDFNQARNQVRANKRKVSESKIDEEILVVLKALAVKHSTPEPSKPSYIDCLGKLNGLEWLKDGPLYRIAVALLGDKENREPWMMIPPAFAVDSVKTVGDKQGYKIMLPMALFDMLTFEEERLFIILLFWYLRRKRNSSMRIERVSNNISAMSGHAYTQELLHGSSLQCLAYVLLCNHFKQRGWLKDGRFISVEEKLAIFQHSTDTVHSCFHEVLRGMMKFAREIVCPAASEITTEIMLNQQSRLRKIFSFSSMKGAIGTLDGTLIHAVIPASHQTTYRGRGGGRCYQNVLVICDFNMIFTFVWAGWEGIAHDSRTAFLLPKTDDLLQKPHLQQIRQWNILENQAKKSGSWFCYARAAKRLGFGSSHFSLREGAVLRTRNGPDEFSYKLQPWLDGSHLGFQPKKPGARCNDYGGGRLLRVNQPSLSLIPVKRSKVTPSLTVPCGKNDTRTFLDYIAIDQVCIILNYMKIVKLKIMHVCLNNCRLQINIIFVMLHIQTPVIIDADAHAQRPWFLTKEEKFNHVHAQVRSVIERSYGVLKARFPILKEMAPFPFTKQRNVIIACFTIHNFIRKCKIYDRLFMECNEDTIFNHEEEDVGSGEAEIDGSHWGANSTEYMANLREQIASGLQTYLLVTLGKLLPKIFLANRRYRLRGTSLCRTSHPWSSNWQATHTSNNRAYRRTNNFLNYGYFFFDWTTGWRLHRIRTVVGVILNFLNRFQNKPL